MRTIAKIAALPVLAAIAFLGYAYGSLYFAGYLFPRVVPRPYGEMLSAAVFGSLVAGLLVALPLARMFPVRHWLAGIAVTSPFMFVRVSDMLHYAGKNEPRIMAMSVAELLIYPAGVIALSWLAARFFPQINEA